MFFFTSVYLLQSVRGVFSSVYFPSFLNLPLNLGCDIVYPFCSRAILRKKRTAAQLICTRCNDKIARLSLSKLKGRKVEEHALLQ